MQTGSWQEIAVEDRGASPADTAAFRIDFAEWLESMPRRLQDIAETLARGESTQQVARQFSLSAGRISQLRSELRRSWEAFQGEHDGTLRRPLADRVTVSS